MSTLESFNTKNRFEVLRDLEESKMDETEIVDIETKKEKCKACGFKTNCHLTSK